MKKVVITGGDGFLGSHLVEALLETEVEITVCDRFRNDTSRFLEPYRDRIRMCSGDIRQGDWLGDALAGADAFYHLIWSGNPALTWTSPLFEVDSNLQTTVSVFERAAEQGVKKLIFPSSAGALYQPTCGLIDEGAGVRPSTPYGIAKLAAEEFLGYFSKRFPVSVDIYRISSLYGPRQPVGRKQGVVAEWCHSIAESQTIRFFGQGKTVRDYVHVDDAARLMTTSVKDLESSQLFNLGSGQGLSLGELLDIFESQISMPFQVVREARRECDAQEIVLDNQRLLSKNTSFKFRAIEDEIESVFQFYSANGK
ncbi:MAG: NAD-dependent epimerase/dehydratase family protein [Verrucomicrobiota bacterium]